MRTRRLARIMTSVLNSIRDRFNRSNSSSYGLLSNNASNGATAQCPTLGATLRTRLAVYRGLFDQHVPPLSCLPITSLIITLSSSAWLASYLLTGVLTALFFFGVIYFIETFLTFAPNIPDRSRFLTELPQSAQFPLWRIVRLTSPSVGSGHSVTLKCFLILQEDPSKRAAAPTILFLHGNAGNIGHRLPMAKILYDVCGVNVFLLEYRGFGSSNGHPNEHGIYKDAMAALDYLSAGADGDIDGGNIFVFGRSLGGAIATELSTRPGIVARIRGTILENTFTSIGGMARSISRNLMGPLGKYCIPLTLIHNRFESLKKLESQDLDNDIPFLFISGMKDEVVPPPMMTRLAKAWAMNTGKSRDPESSWVFADPKDFLRRGREGIVRFTEGNHATTWMCEGFGDVIKRFISLHAINNDKEQT